MCIMSGKEDIRSWAALPSHKDRLTGEIYEPGKDWAGKLAKLIGSIRPGSIVAVIELHWLVDPRWRVDKKRKALAEAVDAIEAKKGRIREVETRLETPKGKTAMLMAAFKRLAYPTKLTGGKRGKPLKLTAEQKEKAKVFWESRKYATAPEATAAASEAIGIKLSLRYMYEKFGPRG